jgi:hypothetical protein
MARIHAAGLMRAILTAFALGTGIQVHGYLSSSFSTSNSATHRAFMSPRSRSVCLLGSTPAARRYTCLPQLSMTAGRRRGARVPEAYEILNGENIGESLCVCVCMCSVCMHACMYVCMCEEGEFIHTWLPCRLTHRCTHAYTCMHTYTHTYRYTCLHTHIHAHTHAHKHAYICL